MALETVAVLGGGAWGTALAQATAMAGRQVTLVVRNAVQAEAINASHVNEAALPGQVLLPAITASTEAEEMQRCLDAGMDECLFKPAQLHVLRACLERWIMPARFSGAVAE